MFAGRTLALLGIVLVALNLRTAVAALSPIVDQVSADVELGTLALGILGMLPPLCFAIFGILTPVFARHWGLERMLVLAILAMVGGHVARGFAGDAVVLIAASTLTFAGIGVGNVLLPPLVKKYFPDRIGPLTALYAAIMAVSTFVPPLLAVPVAESAGWRVSLGMWAVLAVLALVPWITLLANRRADTTPTPVVAEAQPAILGRLWRSSTAWAITVCFTASSINVYSAYAWFPQMLVDTAGVSPAGAGSLVALYAAATVPAAALIPILAGRMRNPGLLVYLGVAFLVCGDLGLILVPATATWLWVALVGAGGLLFPIALVMINLRSRTHEGAVALSGFVQGVGYVIAALGPLVFGLLHEASGGWVWPMIFLLCVALVPIAAGAIISRPHMVEDQLEPPT